jgi:hypothetical protein
METFGVATPLKLSSISKAEQTKYSSDLASGASRTEAVMEQVEDISNTNELNAFMNINPLCP